MMDATQNSHYDSRQEDREHSTMLINQPRDRHFFNSQMQGGQHQQHQQHHHQQVFPPDGDASSTDDEQEDGPVTVDNNQHPQVFAPQASHHINTLEVLRRIERVACSILEDLEQERLPTIQSFSAMDEEQQRPPAGQHGDAGDDYDSDSSIVSATQQSQRTDEMTRLLTGSLTAGGTNSSNSRHLVMKKEFNLLQARSMTSIVTVLSYCHTLLQQNKTTTVREVYYSYVTYFKHQNECDAAIRDAAAMLQVPRHALGLKASPKGWFCGDLQMTTHSRIPGQQPSMVDARAFPSVHGAPIDSMWIQLHDEEEDSGMTLQHNDDHDDDDGLPNNRQGRGSDFVVSTTAARCILVIEKEGIYNRLAEDRFHEKHPCILICGKGFPDLATRAMVAYLHKKLELPVWGLCDCNPFGIMVLHTYFRGSAKRGQSDGGSKFSVPIQWIGLRPSQVEALQNNFSSSTSSDVPSSRRRTQPSLLPLSSNPLPEQVFQKLTEQDEKRLQRTLMSNEHEWTEIGDSEKRWEELEMMLDNGYKMELEALQWLGMDYITDWVGAIFDYNVSPHHDPNDNEATSNGETRNDVACLAII